MTLLSMIQSASDGLTGVSKPNVVVNSADQNVRLLLNLADQEGQELAQEHPWQALNNLATHTTVALQNQGAMTTIAGADFAWIVPDTMWDHSFQWPLQGPLRAQEWRNLIVRTQTGPRPYWRIRGNNLEMYPVPAAGNTVTFEWQSKNWCESSGGTGQSSWAADDDVGRLDEPLMTLGIIWRFLERRGLDYAEPFRKYEMRKRNLQARDGGARRLRAGAPRGMSGSVMTPEGSWVL